MRRFLEFLIIRDNDVVCASCWYYLLDFKITFLSNLTSLYILYLSEFKYMQMFSVTKLDNFVAKWASNNVNVK